MKRWQCDTVERVKERKRSKPRGGGDHQETTLRDKGQRKAKQWSLNTGSESNEQHKKVRAKKGACLCVTRLDRAQRESENRRDRDTATAQHGDTTPVSEVNLSLTCHQSDVQGKEESGKNAIKLKKKLKWKYSIGTAGQEGKGVRERRG